MAKKNNKSSSKSGGMLNDLRYGRSVSIDWFKNNAWLMMIFLAAVLSLMGLRYKTKTKMEQIKRFRQSSKTPKATS